LPASFLGDGAECVRGATIGLSSATGAFESVALDALSSSRT